MKKIHCLLLILCLSAVMMAACGPVDQENNISKDGSSLNKTLVYGSNDYTRINPAIDEHGEINALLFDGLTDHDKENNIVPGLAASWEYDQETFTYTFHLRNHVQWHDGEPFTAEDVKFTIEAIMDPANESEIASNYEDIQTISIPDDKTISFTLQNTNAAFLEYMAIAILPEHLLEGKDMQESDFFTFPVGTGPFMMHEWDDGQSITLIKNDDYYKGAPKIDTVVFKITKDDNVQALQLKSGELDLALVAPAIAAQFKEDGNFTVYTMETADYRGIMYNFNNPFWQKNRELIKAFNYAFERKAMLQTVFLGEGEVAYGPLQKSIYNSEALEKYEHNPEKARELIETAGWTMDDGDYYEKDGKRLSFELITTENEQERIDLANIAAQQLKEIGVECTVHVTSNVDWEKQDSFLIGWGSPFDADDHTYKVFGTGKGNNYSSYSNLDVDKYLTWARQTLDETERAENYARFQQALVNDPAYSFFVYLDAEYVTNEHVTGISENTVLGHHGVGLFWNIEDWDIEK